MSEPGQEDARSSAEPGTIHRIVREEGEAELERSAVAIAWSGLAAGMSMGFSFLCMALLQAHLPDTPWRLLIAAFGYTTGFAIVVLGRQQLFTESTLTAMLPLLHHRDRMRLVAMLRLWGIVLVANLVGTILFALLVSREELVAPEVRNSMRMLANEAYAHAFLPTFWRATFAGWLIATMVWLLPGAGGARLLVILLLTWVVAVGQLSHIIAGSSEAAYGVLLGIASPSDYLLRFLLPTLLGNTVGGVALVALLNHLPLATDDKAKTPA